MTLLEACRQWTAAETEADREQVRERVRAALREASPAPGANGELMAFDEAIAGASAAATEDEARERFARVAIPDSGAPWPAMTAGELLDAEDEALDWLVHDLLPAGGTSLLIGTPKSGKSSLARTIASKVATGRPWLGRETKAGPVLYVALDERRATVREHVRTLATACAGHDAATLCERLHVAFGPRPADPIPALAALFDGIDPAPVPVVIDTLMKALPFEDANDYGLSGESMAQVTALADRTGTHVMLVHHARKDATDPTTAALGSTRLAADVDVIVSLRVDATDKRRLASFVGRDGVSAADLDVAFANDLDDAGRARSV